MSDTKRKVFIIIVLGLVILFGVGQFFAYSNINTSSQQATSPTQTGGATQPTAINVYQPEALAGPVEQGSCYTNSVAAPYRSDAWRCMVGNAISDPCFAIPTVAGTSTTSSLPQLICGANPAIALTSSTFMLTLTKPLPPVETPSSTPTNWAWLVELNDGTLCSPFTGTRPFTAAGDVATYACNGAATGEGMIFGDLNDASATWMAEVGSLSTVTSTFPPTLVSSTTVPVAAVWQ